MGYGVAGYSAVNSTANLLHSFIIFPWPAHREGYGLIFFELRGAHGLKNRT